MKLRLHDHTLRFRLSRADVAALAAGGRVEETFTFAPASFLSYGIETAPDGRISAGFDGLRLAVRVPAAQLRRLAETDEVGIEGRSGAVHVLIEKDFQCLHGGAVEETDQTAFPNPAARVL